MIELLFWSACSLDPSPIENMWYLVAQRLTQIIHPSCHNRSTLCNNRIVREQRKHLDDFLIGRIIRRLECGRTQREVSEELRIAQSVISKLWQRFQNDSNSRLSLQSYSRRTLKWRAPGTRYHQENTIERHRYGGAGWLVWGGIILGSRTDVHVQRVTITGHIYWDVILEQHVRLFRGAMGAEFLFMDENARLHHANIVDECFQSEDITVWIVQHTHQN
ncbi:cubilin [Trichonephila clavipes]|nr:cubilin [Trichonephila clavipes]